LQSVIALCDSFEYVLLFFKDVEEKDVVQAKIVLDLLGQYKFINILFFG